MSQSSFGEALNEQVANEFAAHQQYVAIAVHYDAETLPRLATFFYPGVTAMVLLYLIAFWAIARGVLEIIAAIEFRKVIEGELLLGLAGLLSIAFGIFIVMSPGAGALSIVWVLGAYALVFGITLVILSFRVKSLA